MVVELTKKKRSLLRRNKISEKLFYERIKSGWTVKAAINTPVQ